MPPGRPQDGRHRQCLLRHARDLVGRWESKLAAAFYFVARPLSRHASTTAGEAASLFCAAWDDRAKAAAFAAAVRVRAPSSAARSARCALASLSENA